MFSVKENELQILWVLYIEKKLYNQYCIASRQINKYGVQTF